MKTEQTETEMKTQLLIAYNELNEARKLLLRNDFIESFEFKSIATFYQKINGHTPFKQYEKQWLAIRFNTTIELLFN